MSQTFPDECLLVKHERLVFLDTRLEGEIPCTGCPRADCQVKASLKAALAISDGDRSDFQSVHCARCGGRVYEWRVDGMSRVWRCRNPVSNGEAVFTRGRPWNECGHTYSVCALPG